MIGLFLNTLVLRTDLSDNPSFVELLGRVREVALEAYAHQDLPFEKLVDELRLERDLSRSPLFQVMFILQNPPVSALEFPDLVVNSLAVDSGTAMFDLTLSIIEEADELKGVFEYNTDLFDAVTIQRIAGHFQTLLEGMVAEPEVSISQLPLLTTAERHQLLVSWNDTTTDYPRNLCIHQLFEAQMERTPNAIAVVFEDHQLTYRQLNTRANQLAHHLKGHAVGRGVLVGICLKRSVEMVVSLLGILKAGGAYVPLDPSYPKARLALMLEDAQVPVLLTQKTLLPLFVEQKSEVICLDAVWNVIDQERTENPARQVTPKDLAYVIHTSGSTGKPKGVQIPHRAVVNFLNAMRQRPGLTDQDTLLAVTTLSFDIAVLELFLPITVGARLVVVSRDVAADGGRLLEDLTNTDATVMQATPATWQLLLLAGWQGSDRLKILCGGEALPRDLANQLLQRCASLWNVYGPTEATVWSTIHQVDPGDGSIPIGRPIANTQIYILDSYLQPVPIGVPGELYIGGDGLAQGYLNRPELTAEKFILNPFSSAPGGRLYKTGDLARYLPNSNIEVLGRIDHQVKVRGYRIELGAIEAVLGQHPAVERTVAVVQEDIPGDKRLVAYFVHKGEAVPPDSELRSFLEEKLPGYMVPAAFMMLEALPLTPNGKVDRHALPAPDQAASKREGTFTPPRTPLESLIAEVWQEALGVENVGVYDGFFDLGGHSLLSMQVIARLDEKLGLRISPRDFMFQQTLGRFASMCKERLDSLDKGPEPESFTRKLFHTVKRAVSRAGKQN